MSLEQLFSSLAISGATLVGKAAFTFATTAALKQISTKLSESATNDIVKKYKKLQQYLALITPSIELCEIQSAQGNTSLLPLLEMVKELENVIFQIQKDYLEAQPDSRIAERIQEAIDLIRELVPFIQICTMKSKASLEFSPSLLLQASNDLSDKELGPSFDLTMYSLFQGSVRAKSLQDFTWKEEIARVFLKLEKSGEFECSISIKQNLDDERFHEDDECPVQRSISLNSIKKTFYSTSGSLLNLDEISSGALVLKVDTSDTKNSSSTSTPKPSKPEWIAFGAYSNESNDALRLDYLLRLASLESFQQKSRFQVPDEILLSFLERRDSGPSQIPSGIQEPIPQKQSRLRPKKLFT